MKRNTSLRIKIIVKICILIACVQTAFISCQDQNVDLKNPIHKHPQLTLSLDPRIGIFSQTKSSSLNIERLMIFQFSYNGALIKSAKETNPTITNKQITHNFEVEIANNSTLIVIANYPENDPIEQLSTLNDLEKAEYRFQNVNMMNQQETTPVMCGRFYGNTISNINILLSRLAVKLNISVSVEEDQTNYSLKNLRLKLNNVRFATTFIPNDTIDKGKKRGTYITENVNGQELPQISFPTGEIDILDTLPISTILTDVEQDAVGNSYGGNNTTNPISPFYILPNLWGDVESIQYSYEKNHENAPKPKTNIPQDYPYDYCTYVTLEGYYEDIYGFHGNISYYVMLGENITTNFDLHRNTELNIHLTIQGKRITPRIDVSNISQFEVYLTGGNAAFPENAENEIKPYYVQHFFGNQLSTWSAEVTDDVKWLTMSTDYNSTNYSLSINESTSGMVYFKATNNDEKKNRTAKVVFTHNQTNETVELVVLQYANLLKWQKSYIIAKKDETIYTNLLLDTDLNEFENIYFQIIMVDDSNPLKVEWNMSYQNSQLTLIKTDDTSYSFLLKGPLSKNAVLNTFTIKNLDISKTMYLYYKTSLDGIEYVDGDKSIVGVLQSDTTELIHTPFIDLTRNRLIPLTVNILSDMSRITELNLDNSLSLTNGRANSESFIKEVQNLKDRENEEYYFSIPEIVSGLGPNWYTPSRDELISVIISSYETQFSTPIMSSSFCKDYNPNYTVYSSRPDEYVINYNYDFIYKYVAHGARKTESSNDKNFPQLRLIKGNPTIVAREEGYGLPQEMIGYPKRQDSINHKGPALTYNKLGAASNNTIAPYLRIAKKDCLSEGVNGSDAMNWFTATGFVSAENQEVVETGANLYYEDNDLSQKGKWRLPTSREAFVLLMLRIVPREQNDPILMENENALTFKDLTDYEQITDYSSYWSATRPANVFFKDRAYGIFMKNPVYSVALTTPYRVRCVMDVDKDGNPI